jgi:hypothetical protein
VETIRVWIEGFLRGRYGYEGYRAFRALAAKRYLKRVPWSVWGIMLVLAAAGSYSRVYVGVHYPTDVLAGVVGLWVACGWIEARCVVGTGSRLGDRAVRGKRAALVRRYRTVQYLDSKITTRST